MHLCTWSRFRLYRITVFRKTLTVNEMRLGKAKSLKSLAKVYRFKYQKVKTSNFLQTKMYFTKVLQNQPTR
jgi:hypothetical protein